ncbi:MAG: type II toxin-antitoxin system RelE/ParE family toxin [Methylococcaceae bacterium]
MVIHSRKARLDLLEIWAYIAEDSPNAADKLLDFIDENVTY